jgi:DNA-binding CsgD family transcriptional regulator
MPDTVALYPNKIIPPNGRQALGVMQHKRLHLVPTHRKANLPNPEPIVAALLALNAALLGRNNALLAALDRYDRTAGNGAGSLQNAVTKGAILRVVPSVALDDVEPSWAAPTASALPALTPRQTQILHLVLAGHPSKNIAADLNISQRTVENHRAAIMRRTGATSLPALARMAVGAAGDADCKAAARPMAITYAPR